MNITNREGRKESIVGNIRRYILLYSAFLIYSGIMICSKLAALHKILSMNFFFYIGLEIMLLGMYAIIWQQVLKKFSLVVAMANKGVVVILGLLWSVVLFKEVVSIYNVIGAIIIILGIKVVSKDG
ncbi:MAG: hypothetical protein K0R54_1672 [Clostridiaceae bacterium]|jgi:drug/metabolite transporter superfamily protein YnfA|nr:hypothetical protein [Clostridiaceae bacterium]